MIVAHILQVLLPIIHEWLQILFWEPKMSDHVSNFFKIYDRLSDHGSWKKWSLSSLALEDSIEREIVDGVTNVIALNYFWHKS